MKFEAEWTTLSQRDEGNDHADDEFARGSGPSWPNVAAAGSSLSQVSAFA